MPAFKPPFPIARGNLDIGNWRLAGADIVAFWPFNTPSTVGNVSSAPAIDAITGIKLLPTATTIKVTPDAAQRNGRCVLLCPTNQRLTGTAAETLRVGRALPIAILARASFVSASTNNGVYGTAVNFSGLYQGAFMYQSSAGKLVCGFGDNTAATSAGFRIKTGTTSLVAGSYTDIACVIRGATDMSLYVNGVDDGGAYTGTGGAMAVGTGVMAIGEYQANNLNGSIDYLMQLGPASGATDIDATVIQAVQFDPWALVAGAAPVISYWSASKRLTRATAGAIATANAPMNPSDYLLAVMGV